MFVNFSVTNFQARGRNWLLYLLVFACTLIIYRIVLRHINVEVPKKPSPVWAGLARKFYGSLKHDELKSLWHYFRTITINTKWKKKCTAMTVFVQTKFIGFLPVTGPSAGVRTNLGVGSSK